MWAGAGALAAMGALPASGDEPPAPRIVGGVCTGEWSPPAPPPPPPVMRVVEGVEYVLPSEGRSVIVDKVEPPPEPTPPEPVVSTASHEQQAAAKARLADAARRYLANRPRFVRLSCTVYDHRATLVGWTYQGRQYRAWSNIDFNHIAGITGFESGDGSTRYSLWMGIGNQTTGRRLGPTGRTIPAPEIPVLPTDGPGFVVVTGDATDSAALADMTALHALYKAEGARLKAAYELREQHRIEREAWIKANPPPPRDTILMHSGIVRPEFPVERSLP